MDLMTKLGGRKFLMAILVIIAAMFLELRTAKGLTVETAGFLVAVLGAFSAANFATTSKHMDSKAQPQQNNSEVTAQLQTVQGLLQEGLANPDTLQNLLGVLNKLGNDISQLKSTTGQIGQSVVNLAKR